MMPNEPLTVVRILRCNVPLILSLSSAGPIPFRNRRAVKTLVKERFGVPPRQVPTKSATKLRRSPLLLTPVLCTDAMNVLLAPRLVRPLNMLGISTLRTMATLFPRLRFRLTRALRYPRQAQTLRHSMELPQPLRVTGLESPVV